MKIVKALIFDFDGLILDTEMPRYTAWKELYLKYHSDLSIFEYALTVGSDDSKFDFYQNLEDRYQGKINWEIETPERRTRMLSLLEKEKPLPGVKKCIQRGKDLGLQITLASSSPRKWVESHLSRHGLIDYFDFITTIEETGKAKPDPALFNLTLAKLAILPTEAIVFEDSPNGCIAAKSAGIFCVAVPNNITKNLEFNNPELMIDSMESILLDQIIATAEKEIA